MSDDLTYPEEAMRQACARIAQLEAERDTAEAKLRDAVEIAKSIVRDWESTEEDRWPGGAEEECSSYASRASRIARLTGEEQE